MPASGGARGLLVVGLIVGLLVLPQAAQAQTGEDGLRFAQRFPAVGARMMGLSGAGGGGFADYSALLSNPAGLGYFQTSAITGSLNTLLTLDEAVYQVSPESQVGESDLRRTGLGNLAYIAKAPTRQGSLVLGAAFSQTGTFDRSLRFEGLNAVNSISDSFLPYEDEYEVVEENGTFRPRFFNVIPEVAYLGGAIEFLPEEIGTGNYPFYQAVDPVTTIEQRGDVLEEGRMRELSFGGAVEAARGVMVGAAASLAFGRYTFNSLFEEIDDQNENQEEQYIVILNDGSELRGFDALEYTEFIESNLTGFNLRVGLSAEAAPGLRLGLSLETPTFYSIDEEYGRTVTTFFDVGGSLSYGDQPDDVGRGTFEYTLTTPWRLGGGLTFSMDGLTVLADVAFVDWAQMELDASTDRSYFTDVNRSIRENLQAVVDTRLGLEYRLGNLALRGGFAYQPDPRKDAELDRAKTFFSAGLGYRFAEQLQVDVGWMQERFDDRYAPYGDVETTPPSVEESVLRNRFAVGLQVLF